MRVFGWLLGELPRAVVGCDRVARVLAAEERTDHGTATARAEGGARTAMRRRPLPPPGLRPGCPRSPRRPRRGGRRPVPAARRCPGRDPRRRCSGRRRAARHRGRHLRRPRRSDGRARRRHRLGQVDHRLAARPSARPRRRRGRVRRTRTCATSPATSSPPGAAIVFQDAFLFDDTVRENITLGARRPPTPRWNGRRPARAGRTGSSSELSDGLRRPGRRARGDAVGRAAAAHRARPRARPPAAAAGPRRRHLGRRPLGRGRHPARPRRRRAALPPSSLVAYRRGSIALADEVVFVAGGRVAARGRHEDLLDDGAGLRPARDRLRAATHDRAPRPASPRPEHGRERRRPPRPRAVIRTVLAEGAVRTVVRGISLSPELRVGLPFTLAAGAGRHRRPRHRPDRGPAHHRRRPRRGARVDLGAVTVAVVGAGVAVLADRARERVDERAPRPGGRDRPVEPARPRLPAHPRPVDAAPGLRAARLARLARHLRHRRDQPLHAVGRAQPHHRVRAADRQPAGDGAATRGS